MRVEVDHSRHHDPRSDVDGAGRNPTVARGGRTGERDAPTRIDLDQPVGLVSRAAAVERRQQSGAQSEGRSIRKRGWHAPDDTGRLRR